MADERSESTYIQKIRLMIYAGMSFAGIYMSATFYKYLFLNVSDLYKDYLHAIMLSPFILLMIGFIILFFAEQYEVVYLRFCVFALIAAIALCACFTGGPLSPYISLLASSVTVIMSFKKSEMNILVTAIYSLLWYLCISFRYIPFDVDKSITRELTHITFIASIFVAFFISMGTCYLIKQGETKGSAVPSDTN